MGLAARACADVVAPPKPLGCVEYLRHWVQRPRQIGLKFLCEESHDVPVAIRVLLRTQKRSEIKQPKADPPPDDRQDEHLPPGLREGQQWVKYGTCMQHTPAPNLPRRTTM